MSPFENLLYNLTEVKVIAPDIPYSLYFPLDLSINNIALAKSNPTTSEDFKNFIHNLLKENNAAIAYGGYNEARNLYKRSPVFKDVKQEERTIHIGLDLWTTAETPILAALDGKIHSFQFNNQLGDYGPTIILEHEIDGHKFFTLYGHLSLESLQNLSKGQIIKKGEQIATLGNASINGDYAPHLHFQIIKNIQNKEGDYPGVCCASTLPFYLTNCPDPNLLLKINS
ncbi:peptidoglycan DD-metalloendopeptidase family protein [Flavobacterium sp.]|jgi:murein DD-endopeptidase MepM/ murein hydrolase activator NlpD|uniref:peptidoglycan DD-metalloendopeptidase family protein n=1 Tax=Flavobacterium sp. TaxID=239 RepID=UPI0022BF53DB|nr:peptidoglycan DD-metalloendopeptidase family protein [Flavobacterium sp.]MCZ8229180.1 peptidoglycan DD-metalloendopeptidase family protein [Flavobacterium sp.]